MKKFIFPLFILAVAINIFLASWYVLQQDIVFSSDIARDMFILEEINEKKLILVGPRSSVGGLFHGPLWAYISYPAFVLGNGNPIVMGWFWILLDIVFLVTSYFIAKRLFNKQTAMLFVLMTSMYLVYHSNEMFNPYGAMFLIPAFFFFFVRYIQTKKVKYLIANILITGCIIQFQMAIGLPFFILSFLYIAVFTLKYKKPQHLAAFLLMIIPLSTFILFDLRHEHILLHNVFRHLGTSDAMTSLPSLIADRINTIVNKVEFLRFGPDNGQLYASIIFFVFLFLQIKNNVHKQMYLIFLYFYFGFFIVSLLNRYNLLSFYIYPLSTLVFLIFSSFVTSKYKKLFLYIFFFMYVCNLIGAQMYIEQSKSFIGKSQFSWKALSIVAQAVYKEPAKEFGYFVYAPDIVGYAPRYALKYGAQVYKKNAAAFVKKPITYLVFETPATNNRFTSKEKWQLHQIHIYSKPVMQKSFKSGYTIEKHLLTPEELQVSFDQGANPGLHYR